MTIRAGNTGHGVQRGIPGHGGRAALMARQAEVSSGSIVDVAVRIVAVGALKTVGAADLMRSGHTFELDHVGMALIAQIWRSSAQPNALCSSRRCPFGAHGNWWRVCNAQRQTG